jgi:hypothetical protein
MTPNDLPGPIVTAEALLPWLIALAPVEERMRPVRLSVPSPAEPLRPAA